MRLPIEILEEEVRGIKRVIVEGRKSILRTEITILNHEIDLEGKLCDLEFMKVYDKEWEEGKFDE